MIALSSSDLSVAAAKAESLEENEEPFIAPLGLNVPSDVELVSMFF